MPIPLLGQALHRREAALLALALDPTEGAAIQALAEAEATILHLRALSYATEGPGREVAWGFPRVWDPKAPAYMRKPDA